MAKLKELENTHQKNETDLIDAQKKLAEYEAKLKALESEKETLTRFGSQDHTRTHTHTHTHTFFFLFFARVQYC